MKIRNPNIEIPACAGLRQEGETNSKFKCSNFNKRVCFHVFSLVVGSFGFVSSFEFHASKLEAFHKQTSGCHSAKSFIPALKNRKRRNAWHES
ncbi:MAG: hypothetical protein A2170_11620 [Deltaproteobacteria bacterium RBG_13_53_10]|nr:MAG: hypothetical protein A2170_11620 [Deltaproteobacteria bacterium RBG_13_53_10]